MEKYVIEGLDMDFTTFEDALRTLKETLDAESNYHYSINKDNAYTLCEVVYNEEYDFDEWHDLKPTITVKEYYDMSYDEKKEFFKELEG